MVWIAQHECPPHDQAALAGAPGRVGVRLQQV
jgi:hypothetical protein